MRYVETINQQGAALPPGHRVIRLVRCQQDEKQFSKQKSASHQHGSPLGSRMPIERPNAIIV